MNFTFTVLTIPNNMGILLAQKVDEAESSVVVELSRNPETQNKTKPANNTELVNTQVRKIYLYKGLELFEPYLAYVMTQKVAIILSLLKTKASIKQFQSSGIWYGLPRTNLSDVERVFLLGEFHTRTIGSKLHNDDGRKVPYWVWR